MRGFLETAALAARSNVAGWKKRFPHPDDLDRSGAAVFLPDVPGTCGVIAEVKKRSPSRGDLIGKSDPLELPGLYTDGGAEAVSVVVEEQHFGGSPELFGEIAKATPLPLLWKDFVVDPYQVSLAAGLGASAILLIAGMLTDREMVALLDVVRREGMRALVEVHDGAELTRALDAGADLVGVNNRNLVTLDVNTEVSRQLAEFIPAGIQAVSESGVRKPEDVADMAAAGYRAVLVGESLVTAKDAKELLKKMVRAGKDVNEWSVNG